jgi:hypothetical protein
MNCVLCRYEYRWADGVQIKKPIEVSAPKYVEYLMDWIEGQLDDESIFPQKLGMILFLVYLWRTQFLMNTMMLEQSSMAPDLDFVSPFVKAHRSRQTSRK